MLNSLGRVARVFQDYLRRLNAARERLQSLNTAPPSHTPPPPPPLQRNRIGMTQKEITKQHSIENRPNKAKRSCNKKKLHLKGKCERNERGGVGGVRVGDGKVSLSFETML